MDIINLKKEILKKYDIEVFLFDSECYNSFIHINKNNITVYIKIIYTKEKYNNNYFNVLINIDTYKYEEAYQEIKLIRNYLNRNRKKLNQISKYIFDNIEV
jgi:hypothetical protein